MQTTRTLSLAIVAAVALGSAAEARAERGAVIVGGDATPREREVIARAIEGAAREAAWSLGPRLAAKDVEAVISCLAADRPWPCIVPIARAHGLQRLVLVHAEPDRADSGAQLVLTGQLVVEGNGVPAIDRRYCARCGDAELERAAAELMRRLLKDSASRKGDTLLDVRTVPPGAVVSIDGRMAGESNRRFATHPGSHELLLQRSGYRPAVRKVVVREGQTEIVSVLLERESGREGDGGGERIVPWIAVSGGAVAIVGGAVASFTATSDSVGPQDKYNYSAAGIGITIVGAVALGAGIYMWSRPPTTRSGPTISVLPGGGVAGWTTRL